jgi:hypothetical protein
LADQNAFVLRSLVDLFITIRNSWWRLSREWHSFDHFHNSAFNNLAENHFVIQNGSQQGDCKAIYPTSSRYFKIQQLVILILPLGINEEITVKNILTNLCLDSRSTLYSIIYPSFIAFNFRKSNQELAGSLLANFSNNVTIQADMEMNAGTKGVLAKARRKATKAIC